MFFLRKSLPLALLTAAVAALGISACTGGGGGSDPTPTPTPYDPDLCVIEWQGGTTDYLHLYRFLIPAAEVGGTSQYGQTANDAQSLSAFGLPSTATSLFEAAVITAPNSGTFDMTGTAGVEATDTVQFDDTTAQPFMVLNTDFTFGAVLGSAGVGNFDGEWSPPADPGDFFPDFDLIVVGAGSITIVGTNNTIATVNGAAYGWCVKDLAFAPNARREILTRMPIRF